MRRVIIESPFAGHGVNDDDRIIAAARNREYLIACICDCLARGESPYASHLMLTNALDDSVPHERELGIAAGFAWRSAADFTVVYMDLGVSRGMVYGIDHATRLGHPIEYRKLGGEWEARG